MLDAPGLPAPDAAAGSVPTFGNFIGGAWRESASGETFEDRDPADTEQIVGRFAQSDERDVDDAVRAARAAWAGWNEVPAPKRGEILFRFASLLARDKEA